MKDNKQEWKGTTIGGYNGQRYLWLLIRVLGLRTMYFFSALSILFFVIVNNKETRAIMKYYRKRGNSVVCSFLKVFKNNFIFSQMMFDRLAVMNGDDNFNIEIINNEVFEQHINNEKGFMLCHSHVGNSELTGFLLHQNKKTINSVIFGNENPKIIEKRAEILKQRNIKIISAHNDMTHIFKIKNALDNDEIVSIHCDRIFGSNKSTKVPFLNDKITLPLGPFIIAAQAEVDMLALFTMRDGYRNYKLYICNINPNNECNNIREKATSLALSYASKLEKILYKYPDQWFNFFDIWKI